MGHYARGETFLARAGRYLTGLVIRILKGKAGAAAARSCGWHLGACLARVVVKISTFWAATPAIMWSVTNAAVLGVRRAPGLLTAADGVSAVPRRQLPRTAWKRGAMAEPKSSATRQAGCITDARGRKVTQLDPVAIYLLHQHDVIEAEVARAIANEKGVRIARGERVSLVLGVVAVLLVVGLIIQSLIVGDFGDAPLARTSSLLLFCVLTWVYWIRAKYNRFGKIAAAMLKYSRCPHCGYDLRMLPADPEDGATICPECGCAWKLEHREGRGGSGPSTSCL
jgi:hypothetical protein